MLKDNNWQNRKIYIPPFTRTHHVLLSIKQQQQKQHRNNDDLSL